MPRSVYRSHRMRSRGLLTELLGHPAREPGWHLVAGGLIRARAELTVLAVLVTGYLLLRRWTGWPTPIVLITEGAIVVVMVCVPATRARIWAVTARHRVWRCLYQTRTMTPDGRMPYLLWSSPSPVGERIRVWLPAGLSVNDLAQITEALAAACYAAEATVQVNPRKTHLVTISITRRNPFGAKRSIRPRLLAWLPKTGHAQDGFRPLPDRDTLPHQTAPAEHPTVVGLKDRAHTKPATSRAAGKAPRGTTAAEGRDTLTTTTNATSEPTSPPPAVGVGGMDVSDYV